MQDDLGDRMKAYEKAEATKLAHNVPVVARLDGRGFSKFTRSMERPYDAKMAMAMAQTTRRLITETKASIGFTQSDEITLIWPGYNDVTSMFFDGKVQKLCSVLAGIATSEFTLNVLQDFPHAVQAAPPVFDARVFTVPTRDEAANALLWRAQDARRNGVTSAARTVMSHREMQGLKQAEFLREMAARGLDYDQMPLHHRFGSYFQRKKETKRLTDSEYMAIPEFRRPPTPYVLRGTIEVLSIHFFGAVANRSGVIFEGEEPISLN